MNARILIALAFVILGGCVFVEQPDAGTVISLDVAKELASDSNAAQNYAARWQHGEAQLAGPNEEAKWVAIAGQLYERRIGPTNEYRRFVLQALKSDDPQVAGASAIAMIPMRGRDVADSLFDVVQSPTADLDVRDLASDALRSKITRPETGIEADAERNYIFARLGQACQNPQPNNHVMKLCAENP